MYLRCRTCGKSLFLGKTFGGSYYTSNIYYDGKAHKLVDDDRGDPDAFLDAYNKFLDEHFCCTDEPMDNKNLEPKFVPVERNPENNFEIAYETIYGENK